MIWKGYAKAQPSPQAWKGHTWWCTLAHPVMLGLSYMRLFHRVDHRVLLVNLPPLGTRLQGMALQRETILTHTAKVSENV